MPPVLRTAAVIAIVAGVTLPAHAVPPALAKFSADADATWNYARPAESEQRFRAELGQWPAGDPQALVLLTQIARAQGLQRQFADAHTTLDAIEPRLAGAPAHVRVRFLLERGRVFNSAGTQARAAPLFAEAVALAECDGDDFYAIDALHMLGIAAPPSERLDWDLKALAATERTTDLRSKRWLAPLYNNIGHAHQERGDFTTALAFYRKALPAYEARGDPGSVRVARWMIARTQRSLAQLDEAEVTQRALLTEYGRLGETNGYVFEELAEIALARGDAQAAQPWAAKAYAALKDDPGFAADQPPRLARLAAVAAGKAPPP
ncbi:MAG: tetratricopeptide repeat protein [Betaproteobacteria bacterium]